MVIRLINKSGVEKTPEDFGLIVSKNHVHPSVPETLDRTLSIPGKDGLFYFGSSLGERKFNVPMSVLPQGSQLSLQHKIREFSAFLIDPHGKPNELKLIFDYEPDKFYRVHFSGNIAPSRLFDMADFNLPLTAYDPYAYYVVPSSDITMGSDIPIMSDILWGTGLSGLIITSPGDFTIMNNGSQAIRLSYTLEGSGDNVSLSANGKSFSLGSFSNTVWTIDGEGWLLKKDGINDLTSLSGDFIELMPGENLLTFSGTNLNLTFSENMTYKYV